MVSAYWDNVVKRSGEDLASRGKADEAAVIENGVYSVKYNPFQIEGGVSFVTVLFKLPKALYQKTEANRDGICAELLKTLSAYHLDDRFIKIISVKLESKD